VSKCGWTKISSTDLEGSAWTGGLEGRRSDDEVKTNVPEKQFRSKILEKVVDGLSPIE
jgi:hypothetical protein